MSRHQRHSVEKNKAVHKYRTHLPMPPVARQGLEYAFARSLRHFMVPSYSGYKGLSCEKKKVMSSDKWRLPPRLCLAVSEVAVRRRAHAQTSVRRDTPCLLRSDLICSITAYRSQFLNIVEKTWGPCLLREKTCTCFQEASWHAHSHAHSVGPAAAHHAATPG